MKALVIVDMQNDFMPWGTLPVPEGDQIVPLINGIMNKFDLVVATKDWHPVNHGSFATNHHEQNPGNVIDLDGLEQVLWPEHCVQNTNGAELVTELDTDCIDRIVVKGTEACVDSYSGFFDNARRKATGLEKYLRERKVDEVFITGVATDYCIKYTALDAVNLGFKTNLLINACKGVNLIPQDVKRAFQEMKNKGVLITITEEICKTFKYVA